MVVTKGTDSVYRIGEAEFNATKLVWMLRHNAQQGQVRRVGPALSVRGTLILPENTISALEQDMGGKRIHHLVRGIQYQ